MVDNQVKVNLSQLQKKVSFEPLLEERMNSDLKIEF